MRTLADYWRLRAQREALRERRTSSAGLVDKNPAPSAVSEDDFDGPTNAMDRASSPRELL